MITWWWWTRGSVVGAEVGIVVRVGGQVCHPRVHRATLSLDEGSAASGAVQLRGGVLGVQEAPGALLGHLTVRRADVVGVRKVFSCP